MMTCFHNIDYIAFKIRPLFNYLDGHTKILLLLMLHFQMCSMLEQSRVGKVLFVAVFEKQLQANGFLVC